jgi:hypothetical protein
MSYAVNEVVLLNVDGRVGIFSYALLERACLEARGVATPRGRLGP